MRLFMLVLPAFLIMGMAAVPAASAQDEDGQPAEEQTPPQDLVAEGLQKLMLGLELMLEQIPRYAPPEITPEGDIIIRRVDPDRPSNPEAEADRPAIPL